MKERIKRMGKKGWSDEEVKKTMGLMSDKKKEKHSYYEKSSTRILYWTVLIVLTICNFMASIILIPLILITDTPMFYAIIATLGLIFGYMFSFLIKDLEHLELKHHLFAVFFIPIMAIINLFIMINVGGKLSGILQLGQQRDPVLASAFYVVAFIFPYLFGILRKP